VHPPHRVIVAQATPKAPSSHRSALHKPAVHPSQGKKQIVKHTTPHPVPKARPKVVMVKHVVVKPVAAQPSAPKIIAAAPAPSPITVPVAPPTPAPQPPLAPQPPVQAPPQPDNAPQGPQTAPAGEGSKGVGTGDTGDTTGDSGGAGNGYGPFGLGNGTGEGLRHIVYVIDVSGSMVSRIERVKDEMRKSLSGMLSGESFTILAFGDRVQSYDTALEPATKENITQAKTWLSTLTLQEGTDLQSGLYAALDTDGVNVIILMTDGVPTEGETDFDKIAKDIKKKNHNIKARIYTVGMVGKNPDGTDDSFEATKLLQRLSKDSDGEFELRTVGVATPD